MVHSCTKNCGIHGVQLQKMHSIRTGIETPHSLSRRVKQMAELAFPSNPCNNYTCRLCHAATDFALDIDPRKKRA